MVLGYIGMTLSEKYSLQAWAKPAMKLVALCKRCGDVYAIWSCKILGALNLICFTAACLLRGTNISENAKAKALHNKEEKFLETMP